MRQVEGVNNYAVNTENSTEQVDVNKIINQLGETNDYARENARLTLLKLGKPAVHPLIRALSSHDQVVRWEAAKALGQIADREAIPALIKAMEDVSFDVRWLAAEGLIHIGSDVTVPLLQALISNSKSFQLREGAHHVFTHLSGKDRNIEHHADHQGPKSGMADILLPVVEALEDRAPFARAPTAAQNALDEIKTRHQEYLSGR